jgi:hypothetical protein
MGYERRGLAGSLPGLFVHFPPQISGSQSVHTFPASRQGQAASNPQAPEREQSQQAWRAVLDRLENEVGEGGESSAGASSPSSDRERRRECPSWERSPFFRRSIRARQSSMNCRRASASLSSSESDVLPSGWVVDLSVSNVDLARAISAYGFLCVEVPPTGGSWLAPIGTAVGAMAIHPTGPPLAAGGDGGATIKR